MAESPGNPDDNRLSATTPAFCQLRPSLPRRSWLIWAILGLVLLVLLAYLARWAVCRSGLWGWACQYYYLLDDREKVRAFLQSCGPAAPLTFILTQILQVVFAPIPGEATGFIGGFLFGVPLGMLYSTIGLTVGSMLAFFLGHWLEKRFVARVVSKETMEKFDFLMERQGALIAFFLFVVPGFPKDYLCFILGLSPMSWKLFFLLSTVGRLPGTLILTLQGAKVYEGNYLITGLLLGFCLLLALSLYYYREPLYRWLRTWHENRINHQ